MMNVNRAEPGQITLHILIVLCIAAVLVTSQLNLILGLWCWRLLEALLGAAYADNSSWVLGGLVLVAHLGLYMGLLIVTCVLSKRKPSGIRCMLVIGLTIVYLGFWLGWTALVVGRMARTGLWL